MKNIYISIIITLLTLTTIQAESIGFIDMQQIFQDYNYEKNFHLSKQQ